MFGTQYSRSAGDLNVDLLDAFDIIRSVSHVLTVNLKRHLDLDRQRRFGGRADWNRSV